MTGIYNYWNLETSAVWEFFLALLALAFLSWELWLRRTGGGASLVDDGRAVLRRIGKESLRFEARRRSILAVLGVVGALTYVNFFFFHFPNFVHNREWFHYYIGAKYFDELSYTRLYDCTAVADAENPRLRRRVERRTITNLVDNSLESSARALAHPEACKNHFSDARWAAFKRDLAYWRARMNPRRWEEAQTDHGFNGTPVWNILGGWLTNTAPASDSQVAVLMLLDPLYLIGTILVVWWAFGWRVLSVGLLVFATYFPARFYWTGGALLRWDWLFYTTAALCCLKKERFFLAGLSIGYATLLRVFPGFVGVGPVLSAILIGVRERRLDRRYLKFFAGAAVAVVVLVPISLETNRDGLAAYEKFARNTLKHRETPFANCMGLRTVLSYRWSDVSRRMRDDTVVDRWRRWQQARLRAWRETRPLYALMVVGYLALLGCAVRRAEPWVAAALSATFISVGVQLTGYYYAFIIGVALLHARDEWVGRILLALSAFSTFTAVRPFSGTWPFSYMPRGIDEKYTLMSAATLLVFTLIVWRLGPGQAKLAPVDGVPRVLPGDSDAPARPREPRVLRRRSSSESRSPAGNSGSGA